MNIKLKLELLGTTAVRHVIVPEDISLDTLHTVIQKMFNWENYHLWAFTDRNRNTWAPPSLDGTFNDDDMDPSTAAVTDLFPEVGSKANYEYDFGDGWRHQITRLANPKKGIACGCVKTKGPDGIEDCGGPWNLESCENLYTPTLEDLAARFPPEEFMPRCPAWRLRHDSEEFRAPTLQEILMAKSEEDLEVVANMFLLKPERTREKIIKALTTGRMDEVFVMLPFYIIGLTDWYYDNFVQAAIKGCIDVNDEWFDGLSPFAVVPYFDVRQIGESMYRITASDIVRRFWFENAIQIGKARENWEEAFDYTSGLVRLYGGISEDELMDVLIQQDALPDGVNAFENKMNVVGAAVGFRAICADSVFHLDNAGIRLKVYEDVDDYRAFCKRRDVYPRWKPKKTEDLLDYADEFYFEDTDERRASIERLVKMCDISQKEAETVVTNLQYNLFCGFDEDQTALDLHRDYRINLATIKEMIESLRTTMRLPEYNGNRPCDLKEMESQIYARQKVGRNDPCPCGSGKKFKKCCGR